MKLEFLSADFRKILMKIHPVGAELFLADRRTDRQAGMTKIIVTFHNFANAPRNLPCWLCLFVCETENVFISIVKIKWIYCTWHDDLLGAPSVIECTGQPSGTPHLMSDNSNNAQYDGAFLTTTSRRSLFDYFSVEIGRNISEHNEFNLCLIERRTYKLFKLSCSVCRRHQF
jgi:hypothetical protein